MLVLSLGVAGADAAPSAGCGLAPPEQTPDTVEIDGQTRDFILALPKVYDKDQPHPLVFAFHGRTNTNRQVRSYFRLESAATEPTLIVYPAATRDDKGRNHWWARHDKAGALRDYALFDELLASIAAQYCIDTDRVMVIGHSLGATFANSLACARADKVRAVVTVAGGMLRSPCKGKVAAMLLHNPKDDLVKIADGERARDWFLANNALGPEHHPVEPRDLNCERYGDPDEAHPVIWCRHSLDLNGHKRYYPHNWPAQTASAAFTFFDSLPGEAQKTHQDPGLASNNVDRED